MEIPSEIRAQVKAERDDAKAQIHIGATYQHRGGDGAVIVAGFHEPTGRVYWQKPEGPGLADRHRDMDCENFVRVFALKRH